MKHVLAVLFLAGWLLPSLAAPARGAEVVPLESGGGTIRFEVRAGAPTVREASLGGREYRYLAWHGFTAQGEPGAPALPTRVVRVAVPPTGSVSVSSVAVGPVRVGSLSFPPAPTWETPEPGPDPAVRPTATRALSLEGPRYIEPIPSAYARLAGEAIERGVRLVRVEVSPVSWNPVTREADWSRRIRIAVSVTGAEATTPPVVPGSDLEGEASWRRTVVNPEDAARWARAARLQGDGPPREEAGIPDVWFDDAEGWVKVGIDRNGMYAIGRPALAGLGVPVEAIDPRTFRLYSGPLVAEVGWDTTKTAVGADVVNYYWRHVWEKTGFRDGFGEQATALNGADGRPGFEEIAVWIPGEEDGSFDAGDRVVFHALGPDNFPGRFGRGGDEFIVNPYTKRSVYWLAWGGSLPGEPRRMGTVEAAPVAGAPLVTEGPARLHAEGNTWYDPSMYVAGYRWEEWFWERMDNTRTSGITKRVALPDAVAGSPFAARVRFWGANLPGGSGEAFLHHVRVEVDTVQAGPPDYVLAAQPSWQGFAPRDVILDPAPLGAAPTVDFRFIIPDVGTNPNRIDLVHLCWIDVVYRRDLAGVSALPSEFEVDGGAAGRRVRLGAGADPALFDVTDFRAPRRLTGLEANPGGGVTFSVDAPGARTLAAVENGAFSVPASLEVDERPAGWLRDTGTPVDYLIVAYDEFVPEARILADWRRDHLGAITAERPARVRVVRVSDVYDEFSWGMPDPAALRYFLEYAYRYYGAPTDDPLSYGVFLGDHTYDTRDHLGTGEKSFVLSWENNRDALGFLSFGNVQYVSDDPLARFDARNDDATDLYLGRIPAASRQEARDVIVNKIIRAEEDPDRGPWRTKAILVADDICQGRDFDSIGFGHMSQTEDVDAMIPAVFDRDKIYLYEYGEECNVDAKPDAKRALLASWSDGAWLVNYIGHGADVVLADEHVFDSVDIPLLSNDGRLPVVGTFSCSVGKFSKPNTRGLGEGLLMAPRGGALMTAAATHLTFSNRNARLNVEYLERLFHDGPASPTPVGVALMEAKRTEGGESLKYVCLGDPASRLSVPEVPLTLEGAENLSRGSTLGLTIRAGDAAGGDGLVDVIAQDAREFRTENSQGQPLGALGSYFRVGNTLFRGRAPVREGAATSGFTVPMTLRAGEDGRIRAYAWGEDWDGLGALTPLAVGGTVFTPDDTLGPVIDVLLEAEVVSAGQQVSLVLEDPAGVDLTRLFTFRGILVRFREPSGLELFRADLTDRFQYDLESSTRGAVAFTVPELTPGPYDLVVTAYDNFANRSEAVLRVEVIPPGETRGFRRVAAWPNPLDTATEVLFTLDRAGEVEARIFSVSGRLVWEDRVSARAGANSFPWDGRDRAGDRVANGVYLLQLTLRGDGARHLERLVVYR